MSFGEIENNVSVIFNTGGSTLNIYDMEISQNNITQYLLYNGVNSTINVATNSSLDIVNNKSQFFHLAHIESGEVNAFGQINITKNTRELIAHNSTMYLYNYAAFYLGDTAVVNMHNSKIYIYDNGFTVFSNSVRKHIYSYLYDVYTENLINPFTQTVGEKIQEDSKIKVQLHRPFRGNVVKNWAFDTMEDTSRIVELSYQKRADIKLLMETLVGETIPTVLIDVEHVHTYCGLYASDAPCTGHSGLLDTHSEYYTFQSFIGTGDSKTDLSAGGRYFLELTDYYDESTGLYTYDYAANHDGNPVVTVNNDLYLCLGGVSISNIVFRTTSDAQIYIMNCNHNAETYISQGLNESIFTEGNVSLIAPYGITLSGKTIINMANGNLTSLNAYFINEGRITSGSLITFGAGAKAKMINTHFEEIQGFDYITNNGGDITLYNLSAEGNTIDGSLLNNNVGTISIVSATIKENNIANYLLDANGASETYILSTASVVMNNKFSAETIINLEDKSSFGINGKDAEFNLTNNIIYRKNISQSLISITNAGSIKLLDGVIRLKDNIFDNETSPVVVSDGNIISAILVKDLSYEDTAMKIHKGAINVNNNKLSDLSSNEKIYGLWTNSKASFSFIEKIDKEINELNYIKDIHGVSSEFDMIKNCIASVSNIVDYFILDDTYNEKTGYAIEVKDGIRHAVVRERYIVFDKATPSDYVVTGSVSDIIIANKTNLNLTGDKFSSDGLQFVGWSRSPKTPPDDTSIPVVADYETDGIFDVFETDTKVKLYATWEYAKHRHLICGASSSCTHRYIASHSDMIRFRPLRTTIDLSTGGNYFIDEGDIDFGNINVEVNGNLVICLNGYNLSGITFDGGSGNVYITNCKNSESTISENINNDLPLFNDVSAHIFSAYKNQVKVGVKKAVHIGAADKKFESINVVFTQKDTSKENIDAYIRFENNKSYTITMG